MPGYSALRMEMLRAGNMLVVKFTIALTEILKEHRVAAQRKANEAFVMELLRQGNISAGRTAELLGVNRSQKHETDVLVQYITF